MALNFYFLKNTEIFKFNFFELQSTDFSKIFRDRRGVDSLSTGEFLGKSMSQKNIRVKFSKIWLGGPRSQGVPKFYEGVGVVDRGPRNLSNGVNISALYLSYLELNLIFKTFLNLIFASYNLQIFLKFSRIVEGSILYRLENF